MDLHARLPDALAAGGAVSLGLCWLVIATADRHGHLSMDLPGAVQKLHVHPTPRIGGAAVFLSLLAAWALLSGSPLGDLLRTLWICALPAVVFGLMEDLTKRVGVLPRLLATAASGVLACLVSGVHLTRLDVPMLDELLQMPVLAIALTAVAVAGVANAINIIDGINGLASGTCLIALAAMTALAWGQGDAALAGMGLVLCASVLGFLLLNFPWGKLFLGDGGAYLLGFSLGWMAVLLAMRNPAVSPWACLLICAYPITEVLYSAARRFVSARSPGQADREHLHSLIERSLARQWPAQKQAWKRHAATAIGLWLLPASGAALALSLPQLSGWLVLAAFAQVLAYHLAYRFFLRRSALPVEST